MIIVFAKAPLAGQAKTRLIPRLGAWRAARLHERLTRHAVRTALLTGDDVEVHGTRGHAFFRSLEVPFRLQRGRDLGERMHRALARNPGAILIGTDCPELTPADLRRAARFLSAGYDAVLAPAEDGGYALIALKKSRIEFFRGIAWSGERVYGDTVARLAGYRWRALRRLWDVDRPHDLERVRWLRLASASRRGAPRSRGSRARSGGSGRP
ncbi:MAG TPA: TIGR04282 family arsenosugar biosynthesis glycosyltransferase [Burkholderiales bacterium]